MKKLLFPLLILALGFSSCESDDKDMRIELASPKLTVTTELATATIKWDSIPKAPSYAYALDDATEFTPVEDGAKSVTLTQLARGTHSIRVMSTGDYNHTMDSQIRTAEFDINPTLPAPAPSFTRTATEGVVEVKWPAVKGAIGYQYKFNNAADWTSVGANVLTVTQGGFDPMGMHPFSIRALGQLPDSETSAIFDTTFQLIDTSVGLWVKRESGGVFELTETAAASKIFTATVGFNATDEFEILVNGVPYGFTTFSGNGGVGTVTHAKATVNTPDYYVRESVGQMSKKEGDVDINKFWISVSSSCEVLITVDNSYADEIPRYFLKLVEQSNPSILLEQYFDLMSLGGNWLTGKSGKTGGSTNATTMDGTEPASPTAVSAATLGVTVASHTTAKAEYIANRGLEGWEVTNCYEFLGVFRLSSPGNGILTTPKMTALTAPTTITLTFDAVVFGTTTNNIPVKILNAGTISSAQVKVKGGASVSITPESGNTSFIITQAHCPTDYGGNTNPKPLSNFTVVIQNATADTQVSWDTTGIETVSTARMCLDNIVIKKN
ncbi:hypothetical protein [uncultured Alistipes sp.]|jgi:hypothetical protein|uniref:hypothetical protein n=1 Tax=uncultured Alistipes sp. TaxID=538949 RepID=UPI0025F179DD|nr:hypothetical protein [uncultured Alistipes sp.]